jgi:quercetin dioxygenase-like cupin family protein
MVCFGIAVLLIGLYISLTAHDVSTKGFVLKAGDGESLVNGVVIKVSPETGSLGSIMGEQTFPREGTTGLHTHDQGDELFYIVSGQGTATLGDTITKIGPGDVVFVPRGAVHRVSNLEFENPLVVVFFMDSPELVEEFRAAYKRSERKKRPPN